MAVHQRSPSNLTDGTGEDLQGRMAEDPQIQLGSYTDERADLMARTGPHRPRRPLLRCLTVGVQVLLRPALCSLLLNVFYKLKHDEEERNRGVGEEEEGGWEALDSSSTLLAGGECAVKDAFRCIDTRFITGMSRSDCRVKAKAVSTGAGRRNQKPLKRRLFRSYDDLTSCWAGLAERPVMLLLKLRGRPEAPGGTGEQRDSTGQGEPLPQHHQTVTCLPSPETTVHPASKINGQQDRNLFARPTTRKKERKKRGTKVSPGRRQPEPNERSGHSRGPRWPFSTNSDMSSPIWRQMLLQTEEPASHRVVAPLLVIQSETSFHIICPSLQFGAGQVVFNGKMALMRAVRGYQNSKVAGHKT
ncbi:hypothetical protein L3Q82_006782 [Scortum barcoo]|uniref:Uncharacterized protein n=1 Tax=Scortum barcoo TaxID=214431 RepID=A0ACB8WVX0_9TELE|nr:hypothetical protein L3Q82_006782 [Scortum barcoo]